MRDKVRKSTVIYARVSSEEQEREGWSIPSQIKALRKLAEQNELDIRQEFVESASAKKEGRKEFGRMVSFIKTNKIDSMLCYKVDRLTRNPKDLITVEDLGIDLIFIEGRYDSSPQGRFSLSMMANMARFQVENQALDIQRGMREKVENGGWPRKAPVGYWNDKNKSSVEVDDVTSFYIKQAFEFYASGQYSIKKLAKKLYDMGFRNVNGNKVHTHGIETLLKNPFYYGVMDYLGKIYKGNHKPIISKDLFDIVQNRLSRNGPRNKKAAAEFPYRGFVVCGECGCSITAQVQKGHHYYNCTKSKGDCSQLFIREEVLGEHIANILGELQLDSELVEIMVKSVEEMKKEELLNKGKALSRQKDSIKRIKSREKKLLDTFLDGHLSSEIYSEKAEDLNEERINLELKLNQSDKCDENVFELMKNVLNMAKDARQAFVKGSYEIKRTILENVSSNLLLRDREIVSYQLKEPFAMMSKWPKNPDLDVMWRLGDSNLDFD